MESLERMDEKIGHRAIAGPRERDEISKVLAMQRGGWMQEIFQKQKG